MTYICDYILYDLFLCKGPLVNYFVEMTLYALYAVSNSLNKSVANRVRRHVQHNLFYKLLQCLNVPFRVYKNSPKLYCALNFIAYASF